MQMQCRRGDVLCHTVKYLKNLKFGAYCRRKTYSQISVDLALVVTNAAHLTKLLRSDPDHDELRIVKMILIILSISLEVVIAILLGIKERYDLDDESHHRVMEVLNDVCVFVIFASVLVHVFVSVFVEEHHPPPKYYAKYFRNCSANIS